jgi:hypothetical protein
MKRLSQKAASFNEDFISFYHRKNILEIFLKYQNPFR